MDGNPEAQNWDKLPKEIQGKSWDRGMEKA